jgi:hypothetical protein
MKSSRLRNFLGNHTKLDAKPNNELQEINKKQAESESFQQENSEKSPTMEDTWSFAGRRDSSPKEQRVDPGEFNRKDRSMQHGVRSDLQDALDKRGEHSKVQEMYEKISDKLPNFHYPREPSLLFKMSNPRVESQWVAARDDLECNHYKCFFSPQWHESFAKTVPLTPKLFLPPNYTEFSVKQCLTGSLKRTYIIRGGSATKEEILGLNLLMPKVCSNCKSKYPYIEFEATYGQKAGRILLTRSGAEYLADAVNSDGEQWGSEDKAMQGIFIKAKEMDSVMRLVYLKMMDARFYGYDELEVLLKDPEPIISPVQLSEKVKVLRSLFELNLKFTLDDSTMVSDIRGPIAECLVEPANRRYDEFLGVPAHELFDSQVMFGDWSTFKGICQYLEVAISYKKRGSGVITHPTFAAECDSIFTIAMLPDKKVNELITTKLAWVLIYYFGEKAVPAGWRIHLHE